MKTRASLTGRLIGHLSHLDHDVVRVDGLLDLVDPTLDHVGSLFHQMKGRDKSCTGNARTLVYDGLLHVAFNALQHGIISDSAKSSNRWTTVRVLLARHVLGQRAGDNDDVIGDGGHLFDAQVKHSSEHDIFGLEQLGHGKEGLGGFSGRQSLALESKVSPISKLAGFQQSA